MRSFGDTFAAPKDTDSLREITRELSRLVGRERTRRFIEGVIAEAEVELSPAEVWLLGRAIEGTIGTACLEVPAEADRATLARGLAQLHDRGLVEPATAPARLSAEGVAVRRRLLAARQHCLAGLVSDWESEAPELDAMIARLAEELSQSGDETYATAGQA